MFSIVGLYSVVSSLIRSSSPTSWFSIMIRWEINPGIGSASCRLYENRVMSRLHGNLVVTSHFDELASVTLLQNGVLLCPQLEFL